MLDNCILNMADSPQAQLKQGHSKPFDVILATRDGNEFKAHRRVLSDASVFFEKLLSCDMKEKNEGVIRMEILTDSQMEDVLKFIYIGKIEISSQEHAEDLIALADYLLLSKLTVKAANYLERNISISNCLSIYYVAEKYRCNELISITRKFIFSHFRTIAETELFMHLRSREVEEWISSDEIFINAEEDIFEIILKWIGYERSKRSVKFTELFYHLRLTLLSREKLEKDVLTNDLVKENECCLRDVTSALAWIDHAEDCGIPRPHSPRKALQTCVIAFSRNKEPLNTFVYHPSGDKLYRLPKRAVAICLPEHIISYRGKLFVLSNDIQDAQCYDPDFNRWSPAPWTKTDTNQELCTGKHALKGVLVVRNIMFFVLEKYGNSTSLWKFDFESNSAASLTPRLDKIKACFVSLDKYLYAIGGCVDDLSRDHEWFTVFAQSARFDTEENKWQSIANLQEARCHASGVGREEKVFVVGGLGTFFNVLKSCEVYNVTADEWHFIASLRIPRCTVNMMLVDESLCVLCPTSDSKWEILFYDKSKDEWKVKACESINRSGCADVSLKASSLNLFNGVLKNLEPINSHL